MSLTSYVTNHEPGAVRLNLDWISAAKELLSYCLGADIDVVYTVDPILTFMVSFRAVMVGTVIGRRRWSTRIRCGLSVVTNVCFNSMVKSHGEPLVLSRQSTKICLIY